MGKIQKWISWADWYCTRLRWSRWLAEILSWELSVLKCCGIFYIMTTYKMQEMTTTDLSKFWSRELWMAGELLLAWADRNLTERAERFFVNDWVQVMMNFNSWYVFLTNSEYQVLMFNGDELDFFITLPYRWDEWFYDDLKELELNREDSEALKEYK